MRQRCDKKHCSGKIILDRGVGNGLRENAIVILVKLFISGSGHYPGSPVLGLPLVLWPDENPLPWVGVP